eukprot:scaffold34051_cov160-Skeletonema_menzelii.AAC.1
MVGSFSCAGPSTFDASEDFEPGSKPNILIPSYNQYPFSLLSSRCNILERILLDMICRRSCRVFYPRPLAITS